MVPQDLAAHWLLTGNDERDLIASQLQAPTSPPQKKDAPSRADLPRQLYLFRGSLKIRVSVGGPVAFVGRESSCV